MPKSTKYLDLKITNETLEERHSKMDGNIGGLQVLERPEHVADMFADIHNISCGGYSQ